MTLSTIIGLVAAACTSFAMVPQAIRAFKLKETRDLSLPAFLILTSGVMLWLIYGLMIGDTPLIFANIITLTVCLTILSLKIKYG